MKPGNQVLMNRKRKANDMDKQDLEMHEDGWNRGPGKLCRQLRPFGYGRSP